MLKIEKTVTPSPEQWEIVIEGMRNPMNSWDKIDTYWTDDPSLLIGRDVIGYDGEGWSVLGKNDLALMTKLAKGGSVHAKYRRMLPVWVTLTAPTFWWVEFDTYKVGTVRNSCSKMHKIHVKEFAANDFSIEGIAECGGRTTEVFVAVLNELERLRILFNETHDKKYWRALIELLPHGYNMKATIMLNYEVLSQMYYWRRNHKLDEWHTFCDWIETLPYSELITGVQNEDL